MARYYEIESDPETKAKLSEIEKKKAFLNDLKVILKEWPQSVSVNLKLSEKSQCSSYSQAVQALVDFFDALQLSQATLKQLKQKECHVIGKQQVLHEAWSQRSEEHRRLGTLPPRICQQYDAILRKMANATACVAPASLPEAKTELASYLEELHDWGCQLSAALKKQLDDLIGRSKVAHAKMESNKNNDDADCTAAINDIAQLQEEVNKMAAENGQLKATVDEIKGNELAAHRAHENELFRLEGVIKELNVTCRTAAQNAKEFKEALQRQIDLTNNRLEDTQQASANFLRMVERRRRFLELLENQLEQCKKENYDCNDSDQSKINRLNVLRETRKQLHEQLCSLPTSQLQESRIARILEKISGGGSQDGVADDPESREKQGRYEKLQKECDLLRQAMQELQHGIDEQTKDIDKGKADVDEVENRTKKAKQKLARLQEELQDAQDERNQRATYINEMKEPGKYTNVTETRFDSVESKFVTTSKPGEMLTSAPTPAFVTDVSRQRRESKEIRGTTSNDQSNMAELQNEIERLNQEIVRLQDRCDKKACHQGVKGRSSSKIRKRSTSSRSTTQSEVTQESEKMISLDFALDKKGRPVGKVSKGIPRKSKAESESGKKVQKKRKTTRESENDVLSLLSLED